MTDTEQNRLETLLPLAAADPAQRPEFYEVLMASEVFVLGQTEQGHGRGGDVNLQAGENVQLQQWQRQDGSAVIPFFSSMNELSASIDEEGSYLKLPVRSLFELTKGAELFLNPRSSHGKAFTPAEVEHLLSVGQGRVAEKRVVERQTQVQVGQPADYPAALVDALTRLFAKQENVSCAYLAQMLDPSVDDRPHLVVGIEAEGDVEAVIAKAGTVAGDTVREGEVVDFFQVTPGEAGLSAYFTESVEPFYQAEWGQRLGTQSGRA